MLCCPYMLLIKYWTSTMSDITNRIYTNNQPSSSDSILFKFFTLPLTYFSCLFCSSIRCVALIVIRVTASFICIWAANNYFFPTFVGDFIYSFSSADSFLTFLFFLFANLSSSRLFCYFAMFFIFLAYYCNFKSAACTLLLKFFVLYSI